MVATGLQIPGGLGDTSPQYLTSNNFDFSKKKVIKKILEEMSRKTWVFLLPNKKS